MSGLCGIDEFRSGRDGYIQVLRVGLSLFIPPYSPDLNPIERLWLLMKGEWFSDFYAKSREELTDRLIQALNWIIDRRELNKKTCGIPTKL